VEKRFMSSGELRTVRTARTPTRSTRARPPDRVPAVTPVVLDRYRLQRRLGTGAFGTVWMARDERLERDVAVKILARERIQGGRFEREARAAARLSHPAIVTLYEAAVDEDGAYLVSELVRGCTLDGLLDQGRLSDRALISIAIALCDALEHAHAHGVVHRDVKPSNVLIADAAGSAAPVAKLTDFGVARVIGGGSLTITGDVLGTLAYMAPEQAEGLDAGEAADLYSLALVIYEGLSGVNPVAAGATQRSRRLGTYLPPLRRQRRDLPRELGQAVDMALRPRPRERGSVAELRRALVAVHGVVGDRPGIVAAPRLTLRTRATTDAVPTDPEPLATRTLKSDGDSPGPVPERQTSVPEYPWPARAVGAAATAAMTAWLVVYAVGSSSVPPALAGLLAGVATLLLPRLGWGVLTLALCAAAVSAHQAGAALVLLIALLLPVALLPGRPTEWPLPAGAPALGLIGLGGAWPALAARAGSTWRRAALGALGWVWLLLAAPLAGSVLYLPHVPGVPPPAVWTGSLYETVHHLLPALVTTGVLAPALVWAAGAAVLPLLVTGRADALDTVRVVIWAAVVASSTGVAIAAVHGSDPVGAAPRAAMGAVASAAIALAPTGVRMWRRALRSGSSQARVP
jgi:eukaryotic-like serine/threonine-protein kinase